MKRRLVVPKCLTPSSKALFRQLVQEYRIGDVGGLAVLTSGLISLQQAVTAEATIARDGQVVVDRWGQRKSHPLASVARDCRSAWLAALRQLNLSIGDPASPGRPEGA